VICRAWIKNVWEVGASLGHDSANFRPIVGNLGDVGLR